MPVRMWPRAEFRNAGSHRGIPKIIPQVVVGPLFCNGRVHKYQGLRSQRRGRAWSPSAARGRQDARLRRRHPLGALVYDELS